MMLHSIKPYILLACLALIYVGNDLWLPLIPSFGRSEEPKANPLVDEFRLCRILPKPILGESFVKMDSGLAVDYQCAGESYHEFAGLLEDLVLKESESTLKQRQQWGRRTSITPRNGTSVLIMGNSHTRQLVQAMICQHQEQLVDITPIDVGSFRAQFENNVTLFAVCNSPVVTAKTWQKTLERSILKQPLAAMDAIVLGHFNTFEESNNTKYLQMMMNHHNKTFPKAPKMADIVRLYAGPVIWTGMFAHRNIRYHQQALEMIMQAEKSDNNNQTRTNLRSVYARKYIEKLPAPHDECSSDDHQVGTCVTDRNDNRYREGHRCMGARGGHPDLIAWDVVETLHELLGQRA